MAAKRLFPFTVCLVTVCAGLAAWTSGGALTLQSAQPSPVRIGILPSVAWLATGFAAAIIVRAAMRSSSDRLRLLSLSAVLLVPWLPVPAFPAFYVWTGPLRIWLWAAIVIGLVSPSIVGRLPSALSRLARDPGRAPWLAAIVAATVYLVGAHQALPNLPNGDEPHYLVITQSLLVDHDLKIENTHRRGDYRAYYHDELKPDYLQRGSDGEIYSIHAPGLPAIIAPPFALFGYPGVVVFLALVSACGSLVTWTAVWRVTSDVAASWFGWASVALTAPFFFQSFVAYPDGLAAVLVMVAVLALVGAAPISLARLRWTGVALAILPWLHTRYAVLAVVLGAMIVVRQRHAPDLGRRLFALALFPTVSALSWFGFFYAIYGTPDPRAPYGSYTQSALSNLPRGVVGLLFDQQFGLLPAAPVYVCALIGFPIMLGRSTRLAIELLILAVPYGLVVGAYQMWWGGYSSAGRFLVPVLLTLAIPAGVWFRSRRSLTSRLLSLAGLVVSLLITITLASVDHGALVYNSRDGASRLLLWLSPLVNVTTALPSSFQTQGSTTLVFAAVWIALLAAPTAIALFVERRGGTPTSVALALGFSAVVAAEVALSIVWHVNSATPWTPSTGTIAFLRRYDPDRGQIAIHYQPFGRARISDELPRLTIAEVTPPAGSIDEARATLFHVPAGRYEIEAKSGEGAGRLSVALNREFGPEWSWNVGTSTDIWRREIYLPVSVPALFLRTDVNLHVVVHPVSITGSRNRIVDVEPDRAARYGPAVVFLVGGNAYMEPGGTWIAGRGSADFVIEPNEGASLRLFVRNPPVENLVTLEGEDWREYLVLRPGEERLVDLPVAADPRGVFLRVTSSRGAHPTEFEPGSTDARFLGCWIETR